MLRATVPETPIDEDNHARSRKNQVYATPSSNDWPVDTKTQAEAMNRATEGQLARGVAPGRNLHSMASSW